MSNHYQHILLAIDLHPGCDKTTCKKAVAMAELFGAKLSVVHAIEHISAYGIAQAYPTVLDLEQQIIDESKAELAKLANDWKIAPADQYVEVGSPKAIILSKAAEIKADMIMVGSHGRHGLALLLGSTANAVLHGAPCDVFAIRVKDIE